MRIKLIILTIMSFSVLLIAQSTQLINYQGKLMNKAGESLTGKFSVLFAIYSDSSGGKAIWSETRDVDAVNGLFAILLGSVSDFPDTLFSGRGSRFLAIKIGTDVEMKPRLQISSVPFALFSNSAGKLTPPDGKSEKAISIDSEGNLILLHNGLQIGGEISGVGFEQAVASPDVGYMRFGDNTGWKFHITRRQEDMNAPENIGSSGALLTIDDTGKIGMGSTAPVKTLDINAHQTSNPVLVQKAYPNTENAKLILGQVPAPSFLLGGGEGRYFYIYWSWEDENHHKNIYVMKMEGFWLQ